GGGGGGRRSGGGGGSSGNKGSSPKAAVAPAPKMRPVTSAVPAAASGKRIVAVPPCTASPAVVPVQVVWSAAVTAAQAKLSTVVGPPRLVVVGMNTAGRPPTAVPVGPVA